MFSYVTHTHTHTHTIKKKVGNSTFEFPKGVPTDCNSEAAFLSVYYVNKVHIFVSRKKRKKIRSSVFVNLLRQ